MVRRDTGCGLFSGTCSISGDLYRQAAGSGHRPESAREKGQVTTPDTVSTEGEGNALSPNARRRYEVTRADLPLHCPMDGMSLWDSHPRVYLAIEETGQARCPYCGAEFILKE
jgi:uncharacterized Zn-finger protein